MPTARSPACSDPPTDKNAGLPSGQPRFLFFARFFCRFAASYRFFGVVTLVEAISGAGSPPGSFCPKDGTKKKRRMMKIIAMAMTLTRFCSASSCPTIMWRAMAYKSTSSTLPGLCLASILMNSMPMTMSSARSKKTWTSTSLPSTIRPGIHCSSGTMLSSSPISTMAERNTSSRPAASAIWSRKIRLTRSSCPCRAVRVRRGLGLFMAVFLPVSAFLDRAHGKAAEMCRSDAKTL